MAMYAFVNPFNDTLASSSFWHNNYLYIIKNAMKKNESIRENKKIKNNTDSKIDQDFNGYTSALTKQEVINPKTKSQKKVADLNNKDGEKRKIGNGKIIDEQESDGSANAFEDK